MKEVPKQKLVTPSNVCEKYKVCAGVCGVCVRAWTVGAAFGSFVQIKVSLARLCVKDMVKQGLLKTLVVHNMQEMYTRTTALEEEAE